VRRRKFILAAATAAILAAIPAGWYFGSPWWTLWRMREAARAGDARTLAGYVDIETIARRAVAQERTSWGGTIRRVRTDNEGGRRLVALARRMIAKAERGPPIGISDIRPWLANMPIRIMGGRRGDSYVVHRGLDRFEVRDRGMSEDYGPLLSFRRHGLGWKLEGVRWGQQ
jgi:hypothetical protein